MELFEIKRIVRELITAQDPNIVIIEDDEILTDRGFESIKIIELVVLLEDKFDFEFEIDMLSYETLRTISSISKYIYQRLKEKA